MDRPTDRMTNTGGPERARRYFLRRMKGKHMSMKRGWQFLKEEQIHYKYSENDGFGGNE